MDDLYKKIRTRNCINHAWQCVRQGASTGSPRNQSSILEYEKSLDRNFDRIKRSLRRKRYKFQPARGLLLKKPGKNTPRPIVVSDIPDRIVQRSILDVLQELKSVCDLINNPYSYGGIKIKGGGVPAALRKAVMSIKDGAAFYIKTDISDFFPNIDRSKALDRLFSVLPDDTMNEIIKEAASVELQNVKELHGYLNLFPNEETGVAQGCCLSPFLGNILLFDFDASANSGTCLCIRYIDDILILGETQKNVMRNFNFCESKLRRLGFALYQPGDGSKKATEGRTDKGFEYLGCRITPKSIIPAKKKRQELIIKIAKLLDDSAVNFGEYQAGTDEIYKISVIKTLHTIHRMLHAWGAQYSFCNANQVFGQLDEKIDEMLRKYLGKYSDYCRKVDSRSRRRMLGLQLLTECKSEPILPIRDEGKEIEEIYNS